MTDRIWYAAYGTNMALDRLTCYLTGGTPAGASLACPGARDPTPPQDVRPVVLQGSVYFAWESPTWGGGIAFYDPRGAGSSVGRAYLLSAGQFADLAAQEMHRPPGADLDLDELLHTGVCRLGPGRYESLHVVGRLDGEPVVTFTASWEPDSTRLTAPVAAYLTTMGRGLVEGQGWSAADAAAYVMARPGIGPDWTAASIETLLA